MTKLLVREDFEPHVGKQFRFLGTEFSLPLEHIEGDGEQPEGYVRVPFTLIFRGPKPGPVLPGGIYDVETDTGETFWIHVAPIHTVETDRQDYQAVMA